MVYGCWQATATDLAGNVKPGETVTVRNEADNSLAVIYVDRGGTETMPNPFQADGNGFIRFFAPGGSYRINVGDDAEWRYVAIGLLQESDDLPAPPSSYLHNTYVITSSQTFVPSDGATGFDIEVQAPGGGSGGSDGEFMASGAGGGGEYARGWFTPTDIGASISVTVGAAGTAGSNSGGNGGTGGTTSVGSLISCIGGGGGAGTGSNSTDDAPRNGGAGGTGGSGGQIRIPGQRGSSPWVTWITEWHFNTSPAKGGDSFMGKGSLHWNADIYDGGAAAGIAGGNYGGGAAGAYSNSNTGQVGAVGGIGVVIIREFFQ